jgi:hypothetical protein
MPKLAFGNLKAWGPVIDVALGPSAPRVQALQRAGHPPVWPLVVKALMGTGSDSTCVDYSVIDRLGLLPKGDASIRTVTTGPLPVNFPTFDVLLQFIGPPHKTVSSALRVYAMDISSMGILVLLGRDVLARCHLIYDGPSDQFTFSF